MKCLILGGGGFLGSYLSQTLLAANHHVTIFDQPQARYLEYIRQQGADITIGNFLNQGDLRQAMEGCDAIYHLLSTTVPQTSNENPQDDIQTNVIGSLHLLDEARKCGVKKVIFSSSGGTVYGIPQQVPIPENHVTEPISSYGIGKLTIEKYLHLYWVLHGLDYCVLRVSNAYGERQPVTPTQGAIASFLSKAVAGEEITVWGDGSVMRDYIHASDIARAFVQALTHQGDLKIFNIGSGQGHSLNDIIDAITSAAGCPLQIKYMQGRPFDVPINVLDISRAKLHLNWQPQVELAEGISRTFQWMLKGEMV